MSALLRKPKLREKTGISDSQVHRLECLGLFPRRRKISPGGRAVGWDEDEINEWLKSRPQVQLTTASPHIGSGRPGPGRGRKGKMPVAG